MAKNVFEPQDVATNHTYRQPMTLRGLKAYAEAAREREKEHGCGCRCHEEANAGAPGTTLYDGCQRCGHETV